MRVVDSLTALGKEKQFSNGRQWRLLNPKFPLLRTYFISFTQTEFRMWLRKCITILARMILLLNKTIIVNERMSRKSYTVTNQ